MCSCVLPFCQYATSLSRHLRRLRDHGLIRKLPNRHRYHLTDKARLLTTALNASKKEGMAEAYLTGITHQKVPAQRIHCKNIGNNENAYEPQVKCPKWHSTQRQQQQY